MLGAQQARASRCAHDATDGSTEVRNGVPSAGWADYDDVGREVPDVWQVERRRQADRLRRRGTYDFTCDRTFRSILLELGARRVEILAFVRIDLRIAQVELRNGIDDRRTDDEPREPFVVRGHDVPRRRF